MRRTSLWMIAPAAMLLAACGASMSGPDDAELLGEATAAIARVPTDVRCVELQVAGKSTVTQRADVTPDASAVISLKKLPIGATVFTGSAFAAACAAVPANAVPTWMSDPVNVTLVSGERAAVNLQFRRSSAADVTADFIDESGATCTGSLADCNANPADGCEIDLAKDSKNCGLCGTACAPNQTCASGACTLVACVAGTDDCNKLAADGCEVDLTSDTKNCGACGRACSASNICKSGACVVSCAPDRLDCDGNATNGCETSFLTDIMNCGRCGTTCTPGNSCVAGVCTTPGATCTDGVRNGSEADVDCGGPCSKCADGKTCVVSADCSSASCVGGRCAAPVCCTVGVNSCASRRLPSSVLGLYLPSPR